MRIKIKVTKEIIRKSMLCVYDLALGNKSAVGLNFAIALAIRDLFPFAAVSGSNIFFHHEALFNAFYFTESIEYPEPFEFIKLPQSDKSFILDFDSRSPEERLKMKPMSFEIDIPESVIQQIGIGHIYKVLSESKTLEHVI